jgi:hypothetical protein
MSITIAQGDIFLAPTQAVALGLNAAGRLDISPLFTAVQDRYPVFASDYRKRSRAGLLTTGSVWVWREGQPWIVGLVVRETLQGAVRPRYVEAAMLYLHKNWQREELASLAVMRLAEHRDWPPLRQIVEQYLGPIPLPTTIYEEFLPGVAAEPLE